MRICAGYSVKNVARPQAYTLKWYLAIFIYNSLPSSYTAADDLSMPSSYSFVWPHVYGCCTFKSDFK